MPGKVFISIVVSAFFGIAFILKTLSGPEDWWDWLGLFLYGSMAVVSALQAYRYRREEHG